MAENKDKAVDNTKVKDNDRKKAKRKTMKVRSGGVTVVDDKKSKSQEQET